MKKPIALSISLSACLLVPQSSTAQLQWTVVTPPPTGNHLSSIAHGNGLYVAVGNAGTILTSPDGTVWTQQSSPASSNHISMAYGSGRFVITSFRHYDQYQYVMGIPYVYCHQSTGLISSTDGITWTVDTSYTGSTSLQSSCPYSINTRTSVAFCNGNYAALVVFTAPGYGSALNPLINSSDGTNWSNVELFGWTGYTVSSCDSLFMAVSNGGNIRVSTNALSWGSRTSGLTSKLNSAAYGNGQYIIAGDMGTVLTSPDNVDWTIQSTGITANLKSVTFNNGQYVAAGASGTILNSSDGVTWILNSSGTTDSLNSVASDTTGRFVVVGNNGTIVVSNGTAVTNYNFLKPGDLSPALIVNVRNGFLTIDLPSSMFDRNVDLSVYSVSGRVVVRKSIARAAGNLSLPVPNLAGGAYVLSVNDGMQKSFTRFVVAR